MTQGEGSIHVHATDKVDNLPPAMGHDFRTEYVVHGQKLLRCPCGMTWEGQRYKPRECCLDRGEKAAAQSGIDEGALLADAEAGHTYRDLAKRYGIRPERVSTILRRRGYFRGRGTTNQSRARNGAFVKDDAQVLT